MGTYKAIRKSVQVHGMQTDCQLLFYQVKQFLNTLLYHLYYCATATVPGSFSIAALFSASSHLAVNCHNFKTYLSLRFSRLRY